MERILEYLQDNFLIVIGGIVAMIITFVVIDIKDGENIYLSGKVIDLYHQEEVVRQTRGVIVGNKSTHPTYSTETTPEKFILTIRTESGKIVKVETNIDGFYNNPVNSTVSLYCKIGAYSHCNYDYNLKREQWN